MSRHNMANPDRYKLAGRERPNTVADARMTRNRKDQVKNKELQQQRPTKKPEKR